MPNSAPSLALVTFPFGTQKQNIAEVHVVAEYINACEITLSL
jgi:hypothetical protein